MLKLILSLILGTVISLPLVSLNLIYNGIDLNYWPQNSYPISYSHIVNNGYIPNVQTNGYIPNVQTGVRYVRYFPVQPIAPATTYVQYYPQVNPLLNPIPSRPFIPIINNGLGGVKIYGPGLPTHPDYRPPTQWRRIWPPLNERPIDETPVNERPVNETPINETPVSETPDTDKPPTVDEDKQSVTVTNESTDDKPSTENNESTDEGKTETTSSEE